MMKNDPYTQEFNSQIKEIKRPPKYMNTHITQDQCEGSAFFSLPMYFFNSSSCSFVFTPQVVRFMTRIMLRKGVKALESLLMTAMKQILWPVNSKTKFLGLDPIYTINIPVPFKLLKALSI